MALSWYIIYTDQLVFSLECQNFLKIIVSNEIMRNSDILMTISKFIESSGYEKKR